MFQVVGTTLVARRFSTRKLNNPPGYAKDELNTCIFELRVRPEGGGLALSAQRLASDGFPIIITCRHGAQSGQSKGRPGIESYPGRLFTNEGN